MIWVCGWCAPGQREVREIAPYDDLRVTHGMCAAHDCLIMIEMAERQWRRRLEEAA